MTSTEKFVGTLMFLRVQKAPPVVLLKMPLLALPAKTTSGVCGSTAKALAQPPSGPPLVHWLSPASATRGASAPRTTNRKASHRRVMPRRTWPTRDLPSAPGDPAPPRGWGQESGRVTGRRIPPGQILLDRRGPVEELGRPAPCQAAVAGPRRATAPAG